MTNKRKCEKMQNTKLVLSVELDAGNNFFVVVVAFGSPNEKK